MARMTDVAIRRATLIERLEALAADAQLHELRELGQALRELDDPDRHAPMADAVRATALRLAAALPGNERDQALAFARREAPEEVALVLPEWAARVAAAPGAAAASASGTAPQASAVSEAARSRVPAILGSPHLLEQVAHELEAPTDALETAVAHLRRYDLDLDADRAAGSVAAAADSLRLLLNDLLDLASLGDGRFAAARIEFDARSCLVAALDGVRPRADRRGTALVVDVDASVPEAALGDPGRLRQVLHTLAGNAVDAGEGGEVVVRVTATRGEAGVTMHVAVRARDRARDGDHGTTRAQRQSGQRRPNASAGGELGGRRDSGAWVWRGGARTGLGLAIARQLVEQMGGRTWVGTSEEGGSEIHFEVALGLVERRSRREAGASGPIDARLVVVAQPEERLDGVLEQLEGLGALVVPCTALATAAARMRQAEPDAVLVVGSLASRAGARFVEDAARLGGKDGPPKVLLTRSGHRGDAARCRSLGIAAYLSLPASGRDLGDTLRVVCGRDLSARGSTEARRHSQPGRGALVTRHFLRESRRQLRVAVHADGESALAARFEALGHEVMAFGAGDDADIVVVDGSGLGADGIAFVVEALQRLQGGQRSGVLVVLDEAAAGRGLPAGLAADEIAVAPVSDDVLAEALPRLRARRVEPDEAPALIFDAVDVARRLHGDVAVAKVVLAAAQRGLADLAPVLTDQLARGELVEAARAARTTASILQHLGVRAGASVATALGAACRAGDLARAREVHRDLEARLRGVLAGLAPALDTTAALRQHGGWRRTTAL